MEYKLDNFKRSNGNILRTTDGFKFSKYKVKGDTVYLRCVLSKKGCKGTGKLNIETNLIYPISMHNHDVGEYKADQ